MQALKTHIRNLTAAIAIGALGFGFSTAASAIATYNALSDLMITLDSVSGPGWIGSAQGINDGALVTEIGTADAFAQVSAEFLVDPMVIGTPYQMGAASSGIATDGTASSEAYAEIGISIANPTADPLTFNFSYTGLLDAMVTGNPARGEAADAYAALTLFDDLLVLDIFEDVQADLNPGSGFPRSDMLQLSGDFSVTLFPDEENFITAWMDTNGSARGVQENVPEPASLALMAAGLMGVGAVRRRKAA